MTKTDFDPQSAQLHVSGRIVEETKFTKVGQYHTLDLEVQRNFSLEKSEGWDSVAMELVREACDPTKKADVWAVVMQEGLANLAVLTGARTVLRQRVEVAVPKKRGGGAGDHDQVSCRCKGTKGRLGGTWGNDIFLRIGEERWQEHGKHE